MKPLVGISVAKTALILFVAASAISIPLYRLPSRMEYKRHTRITVDIQKLRVQVTEFKQRNGFFPPSVLPVKDPWGRQYIYVYPGRAHRDKYDLFSAGPDGIPYTADDDWGD